MLAVQEAGSNSAPRSYSAFRTKITPMTGAELLALLEQKIERREKCVLASLNMHALRIACEDPVFRGLHMMPETYVHIDGMPIVLLCRLAGLSVQREHRVACLDFIWPLLRSVNTRGWRAYYIGAERQVLLDGLKEIRTREEGIEIAGHSGYFDHSTGSNENNALLNEIAEFEPNIIFVGMGMGKQERWIYENLHALPNVPICTVGALIEYLAGSASIAPRWMGRWGIEWCYRLTSNPARFWHRYLVEPFTLIPLFYRLYYKGE